MALLLERNKSLPAENTYPLAAIREGVVFPRVELVLTFGRNKSVKAVEHSFSQDRMLVLVSQRRASVLDPENKDLYDMGVLVKIERTLRSGDEINALVRGISRIKVKRIIDNEDMLQAEVETINEVIEDSAELEALSRSLLNDFKKAVNLGKPVEFLNFMKLMSGVDHLELVDQIASTLDISTAKKQKLLETLDLTERMKMVVDYLSHEVKVLEIERTIASKTQKKFDKNMRENVLRERIRTMQKELGEVDDEEQEIKDLRKQIKSAGMPKKVEKKALKELDRLDRLSAHSPEHSYIRTWLETIIDVPWNNRSKNNITMKRAQRVLATEHYALKDVKERIEEYLAVLKLKKENKDKSQRKVPTILCFAGPPGVGKTSIGRSIAKALGREFVKVSLGGIRDEAEIRGHRRTYVGAMPGRIIQGIIQSGTKNPVFMLDEIDKVGNDFRGDPSSALLEALDPEQNHEFSDHYLEVPFDLSEVIFITTANVLSSIPPALRDRLEIITFSGYTTDEKFEIAKRHLIDKTLSANGLNKDQVKISSTGLNEIIRGYTRESGVRNLEREISKVMRKAAKRIAANESKTVTITQSNVEDFLGPRAFSNTMAEKADDLGIATGLAWTSAGGDILFVEVALMPGKGAIELTGKLGDVMKESAKAAWSYVRSHWKELKLEQEFYKDIDVHIHVPEGAVPKDGPSAGVTMTTALISALTKRKFRREVGMTGEITLRGRVLEIGGVKEKVIAAHTAGLKTIILPKENKKDLVKLPKSVKEAITFHFVDSIDQVLPIALRS